MRLICCTLDPWQAKHLWTTAAWRSLWSILRVALVWQDKQGQLSIFLYWKSPAYCNGFVAVLTIVCDYFSYKNFQHRDCMVKQMLFHKSSAELNGLPDSSIANNGNKSYMHILALLSSPFWDIFWPETEYQKESKIISSHIASCFKASIRNMEIVLLVYVHWRSNAVISCKCVEEKGKKWSFHGKKLGRVTSLWFFCIIVPTSQYISLL